MATLSIRRMSGAPLSAPHLKQDPAILHNHLIRLDAVIAQDGDAGLDVELPPMPWTIDDGSVGIHRHTPGFRVSG